MRMLLMVLLAGSLALLAGGAPIAQSAGASAVTSTSSGDSKPEPELQEAYEAAWRVSNTLEEWSNWIVDGNEADRPTEAGWEQVFEGITRVIMALCRSGRVECVYPEQGY